MSSQIIVRGKKALVLMLLVGTAGIAALIPACSSQPGRTKFINDNPYTGHTEHEYIPNGPTTTLPPGWQPGGEQTVEVIIDGKRYRIRICIARSTTNPTCIYVNLGGCGSNEGWQMYCQEASNQGFAPPPNGDPQGNPSYKIVEGVGSIDPSDHCPDEWGSAHFDEITGQGEVSFKTACYDEPVPANLVGEVTITAPGSVPLPWELFSAAFNGTIPVGSLIEISGSDEAILWNCHMFGRNRMTFPSTEGEIVDAGIAHTVGGPPVAILAVNGKIKHTQVVYRPQQ